MRLCCGLPPSTERRTSRLQGPPWFTSPRPARFRRDVFIHALASRIQEQRVADSRPGMRKTLRMLAETATTPSRRVVTQTKRLTPGTHVIREWGMKASSDRRDG
ncbi:MAG: DUF2924 domain-containing protein [Nitrospirales bacterium]